MGLARIFIGFLFRHEIRMTGMFSLDRNVFRTPVAHDAAARARTSFYRACARENFFAHIAALA
jgi:hypothetical protein